MFSLHNFIAHVIDNEPCVNWTFKNLELLCVCVCVCVCMKLGINMNWILVFKKTYWTIFPWPFLLVHWFFVLVFVLHKPFIWCEIVEYQKYSNPNMHVWYNVRFVIQTSMIGYYMANYMWGTYPTTTKIENFEKTYLHDKISICYIKLWMRVS
jgi:hypothetical protein